MPSKKQYNLVHNDEYDTRIPLHSEEAFHRGIVFHAKFIGSMEVPRPTSRMEIVAAMRRIRYEFKAKGIKKKKVTLEVSVDGLKVTLRKKKKKHHWLDESKLVLMHHPIYRIFYVSHDSHDLKIFSYIARDGSGNSFRCNVFKSSKKSQAMRVVRTVGQAFEVCHKLSLNNPPGGGGGGEDDQQQQLQQQGGEKDRLAEDGESNRRDPLDDCDDQDDFASLALPQPSPSSVHKDISLLGDPEDSILDQPCPLSSHHHDLTTPRPASPLTGSGISDQLMNGELTALKHEIQLLRERLDQQSQQTRAAVAHARLLQDQLAAETAARVEAQARTHQLLVQNKELLEHIAALVSHLREHERISGVPMSGQPGQVNSAGTISQGSAVADITGLGQYKLAPWDQQCAPPRSPYPPLNSYYPGLGVNPLSFMPRSTYNGYAEELRYQAQLWESLQGANPYAVAPPPIPPFIPDHATSPYYYGYGFTLPPSGRARSVQPPASPRLLRSSPNPMNHQQHHQRSRSLERPVAKSTTSEASFIKPLPCRCRPEPKSSSSRLMNSMRDLVRPLVLEQPMQPPTRSSWSGPELRSLRPGSDFMPKIDESEDERVAQSPRSARRNSR